MAAVWSVENVLKRNQGTETRNKSGLKGRDECVEVFRCYSSSGEQSVFYGQRTGDIKPTNSLRVAHFSLVYLKVLVTDFPATLICSADD